MTARVAVFGATRADVFPLQPVLATLRATPDLEPWLLTTDLAPLADLGIEGLRVHHVAGDLSATDLAVMTAAGADLARNMAKVLDEVQPRCLVVLGDRWELLYAVPPAVLRGIPIVHLHGGELSEGAVDDRIRHAVTKLADLHCVSTAEAARRLRQLGEPEYRITITGAPSLDQIAQIRPLTEARLTELLGFDLSRPLAIVTYHPVTAGGTDPAVGARAVLSAVSDCVGSAIVTHPGNDYGREAVLAEIRAAQVCWPRLAVVEKLGAEYLPALAAADILVGNSSSGIIEAASFGLPVVDVGDRQRGRARGPNVIHAEEDRNSIAAAIRRALSPPFVAAAKTGVNPYGDGKSALRVVEVIRRAVGGGLVRKPFVDLPTAQA